MRKSDLVFFSTGAAALVYETAWVRLLARVLGSDASAAAGALLGPFALMPALGLAGSLLAAAAIDVAAAALALRLLEAALRPEPELDLALRTEPRASALPTRSGAIPTRSGGIPWPEPILWASLLLGAASLALEVLLLRLLSTVTGASVYALAIVLSVFLFGIGFGSRQLASRRGDPPPSRSSLEVLLACALAAPLLALAGLWALRWQLGEGDLFASLANRAPQDVGIVRLWAMHALFAALA